MKLLILIILALVWGSFQPIIFPIATFGYTFLFTAFIGGYLIGEFGPKLLEKYFNL